MKKTRYVIITPVKNEERYIRKTIQSVTSQTAIPAEWVIVNDGSTDKTGEIAVEAAKKYRWIKVMNLPPTARVRGGHIVRLFYKGIDSFSSHDYEYIVKLDGDVSFSSDFFERIFSHFSANRRLGISSGISHIYVNEKLEEERSALGHTLGATKVYRKECFAAIGGLVENMGWDGIDEIKARMLGWDAEPVPGLVVVHHRPEGKARGFFKAGIERGKGSYFMGYHPVFFMLRAFKCMLLKDPPVADGLGMMLGYFGALIKNNDRIPDSEFIRFLRKNQVRKLFLLKSKV